MYNKHTIKNTKNQTAEKLKINKQPLLLTLKKQKLKKRSSIRICSEMSLNKKKRKEKKVKKRLK